MYKDRDVLHHPMSGTHTIPLPNPAFMCKCACAMCSVPGELLYIRDFERSFWHGSHGRIRLKKHESVVEGCAFNLSHSLFNYDMFIKSYSAEKSKFNSKRILLFYQKTLYARTFKKIEQRGTCSNYRKTVTYKIIRIFSDSAISDVRAYKARRTQRIWKIKAVSERRIPLL